MTGSTKVECIVANGYLPVHLFICQTRDPCPNHSTPSDREMLDARFLSGS